jgi:sialidase-1
MERSSRNDIPALAAALVLTVIAIPPTVPSQTGGAQAREEGLTKTVLRRAGDDGVNTYRIPGLTTTPRGTLVAVFDMRRGGPRDLPADIDIGSMRSTDLGRTWSPVTIVLDFNAEEEGSLGNGVGDPAVLADDSSGDILVAALWSKGDRGWAGSGPGLEPGETGQLVIAKSTDDGVSWSAPDNITKRISGRDPKWRLLFTGPGRGIRLRDGTLVFAAQYRDSAGAPRSCLLYSGDGGKGWALTPPAIPGRVPTSEAQVAELPDGGLLLSMRDESRAGTRAWARFTPGRGMADGAWSEPWFAVADPTCMAGLVKHPEGPLLFSNPDSPDRRVALTVRASIDGGRIWTDGRLIEPAPSGYSCMTVLPDSSIGLLYETGRASELETLTFARFTLDWLLGG